ncbi:hypothetical protein [Alteromonas sp. ASW11-130]|uniref:hypothetical protein n=1 Tax=Alteromonas sp. ASW11-130 TaxID=3015775 RepID=UPI002241F613|nr:hypothetical protein [Alteromonas sp. ASW11-130]MCW8093400.1 hypothetical protein [Alteromonas sp. ASW11-130]
MENVAAISSEQKFKILIKAEMRYLADLFDFDNNQYDANKVKSFINAASHGERLMAQFALGVWPGTDKFNFDFTEAAAHLEQKQIKTVTDWLQNPFWP